MITTMKWTLDDYHHIVDAGILDDRHVELLNGEIIEMAPEGTPHSYYGDEAAEYLRTLLQGQAKVREGRPITLPDHSEPEPDLAIVEPLGTVYLEHHPYPENIFWLIEFSDSSLTKDLEVKTKIYATAGIQEYWVVNLRQMKLVVFRQPETGDYASKQTFTTGDMRSLAFPDISVSIDRLLGKSQNH
jgi:Uma2 family endonuclease